MHLLQLLSKVMMVQPCSSVLVVYMSLLELLYMRVLGNGYMYSLASVEVPDNFSFFCLSLFVIYSIIVTQSFSAPLI